MRRNSIHTKESFITKSKKYKNNFILFFIYLLTSYLYFALSIGIHFSTRYIGSYSHDQISFIWALYWWPYAIIHHINPIFTKIIWSPIGTSLSIAPASVAGPAIIASPITLIFGPVVSYNILIIIGAALSAFLIFLILKRLTKTFYPSAIGALLFAFSTYQYTQKIHLNLELTFFIPLFLYLCLLFWEDKLKLKNFLIFGTLTLVGLFLTSTEIFITFFIFLSVLIVSILIVYPESIKRIIDLITKLAIMYLLTAIIVSPFIISAIHAKIPSQALNAPTYYSIDLLNFLIPTNRTLLGANEFLATSQTFLGNVYENSGYMGIGLILLLTIYIIRYWNEKRTKVLFIVLTTFMILSLGPYLHIAGSYSLKLPETIFNKFIILNQIIPERLSLYVFLTSSIIVGLWLAKKDINKYFKYGLAIFALILIFPNLRHGNPNTPINIPYFFSSGIYKQYINKGDNVLYLPYGGYGDSMLYQEQTKMYFNLAEGYVAPWDLTPSQFLQNPVTYKLAFIEDNESNLKGALMEKENYSNTYFKKLNINIPQLESEIISANDYPDLSKFIKDFNIKEIIVDTKNYPDISSLLSKLNTKPINIKGILVYKLS